MRKRTKRTKRRPTLVLVALGTLTAAPALPAATTTSPMSKQAATPELSDKNIRDAVENEILFDPAVNYNNVDVKVEEGVVTLTGTADNLLASERAVKIAETVRGVRSVVNRLDVRRADRRDAEIGLDIQTALLQDAATDSYQIRVSVDDGVATLTGSVDSWYERDLAGMVAKGVRGVRQVENELIWNIEERSDYDLTKEIAARLKWDVLVDGALIDVGVEDGSVSLTGTVGSAAEKRRARIDAWVPGVSDVDVSGLKVESWAHDEHMRKSRYVDRSAEQIRAAVEDAMLYDPRVLSTNVATEVSEAGSVTLRGAVDNLKAKRAAAQDARNTVGVIAVHNRLKVRPDPAVSDRDVREEVRSALRRDPFVDSYEIDVRTSNGVVDLFGEVDTSFEKAQAEDAAARVKGVIAVDNHLDVSHDYERLSYDPYLYDWYPGDYLWYEYRPRRPMVSDVAIHESIRDQLWWSPFVDADEVNVSVENGVATLTGEVDSWSERATAAENAYEGGAMWVENRLIVR